eukprot:6015346-Alexandrium_andersonii.AAC.1
MAAGVRGKAPAVHAEPGHGIREGARARTPSREKANARAVGGRPRARKRRSHRPTSCETCG